MFPSQRVVHSRLPPSSSPSNLPVSSVKRKVSALATGTAKDKSGYGGNKRKDIQDTVNLLDQLLVDENISTKTHKKKK